MLLQATLLITARHPDVFPDLARRADLFNRSMPISFGQKNDAALISKRIVADAVKRTVDKALEATGGAGYFRRL
jgi:alkylation response protein AidB-like acyl-CoA dehydrogenase